MNKKINVLLLVVGMICLSVSIALAATSPPKGVNEIIEQIGELEESFESQNWGEAEEAVEKIDNELKEVFVQSKLNDTTLTELLDNLKQAIGLKEEKLTETKFILFQNQYFKFLNNFDYEIHPLLTMIQQYIADEAPEALAKKDYDDVVSEMREAANLLKQAKPLLAERGILATEVSSLQSQIVEAIKAGRAHDDNSLGVLLKEIEEKYLSMIKRYKAAST